MSRIPILLATLGCALVALSSHASTLLIRADNPPSPEPLRVNPTDSLCERIFQIPTEVIARRLGTTNFANVVDILRLEQLLRTELASRRVEIADDASAPNKKELRIAPPSRLFVRATRKDLAKIDLLLADWMSKVHFEIEIVSAEFSLPKAKRLLSDLSITVADFGTEPERYSRFDVPIATTPLTTAQKLKVTTAVKSRSPSAETTSHKAFAGEEFVLGPQPLRFNAPTPIAKIDLNPRDAHATDLKLQVRTRDIVRNGSFDELSVPGLQPITINRTHITTYSQATEEAGHHTILQNESLLVIAIVEDDSPAISPPRKNRKAILTIFTPVPIFHD